MTKMTQLALATVIILCLAGVAIAETTVDVSGQVRARLTLDSKATSGPEHTQEYTYLRTRLNVKALKDENLMAFV